VGLTLFDNQLIRRVFRGGSVWQWIVCALLCYASFGAFVAA